VRFKPYPEKEIYSQVLESMGKNMKRFMMSISDEMHDELEKERKVRRLETVQEVTRQIVSDYLRQKYTESTTKDETELRRSGD
jgi:metal-responsive CopG/Arc/MetJ family transcriptional regulator